MTVNLFPLREYIIADPLSFSPLIFLMFALDESGTDIVALGENVLFGGVVVMLLSLDKATIDESPRDVVAMDPSGTASINHSNLVGDI